MSDTESEDQGQFDITDEEFNSSKRVLRYGKEKVAPSSSKSLAEFNSYIQQVIW